MSRETSPVMAFLLLVSLTALAQDQNGDQTEKIEELIVSAKGTVQTDHLAHLSAAVLGEDAIQLSKSLHPNEIFSQVPGVWVSRGSGQEHLTAMRSGVLTGAGACGAYLLLENGIPIRPASFCNVNGLFELNTEQASAVEVIRGPASSRYGGNALHGVINVITMQEMPSNSVEASFGSHGLTQAKMNFGNQRASMFAHTTQTDGWRDSTGYSQTKLNAQIRQEFGYWQGAHTFAMTSLDQETGGYVVGLDAYQDDALRFTNPNPEAYRDAMAIRYGAHLRNGDLVISPYLRHTEMDFLMHFLPGKPREENAQTSGGVLTHLSCDFEKFTVSLGFQAEFVNAELSEIQSEPTVGSAFLMETRPIGTHYDFSVNATHVGVFHDGRFQVTDPFSIKYRVRMESANYRYNNLHLDGQTRDDGTMCGFGGCLYTRPGDRNDTFLNYSMQVGFESQLRPSLVLHGSIGSGFRPPQIAELYRLQNGQTVPEIESESLNAVELGITREIGRNLLQMSLYSERTRNLIIRDAEGFNQSAGAVKSSGLELYLQHSITNRQDISLTWTFADHRYDFTQNLARREVITAGNTVDTAPQQLGSVRWLVRANEHVQFGLEGVGVSSYYLDAANTETYSGHLVVHGFGRWNIGDSWEIQANVRNLLDKKYADRADLSFGNVRYFPAMPRNAQLGLKFDF